jgi:predicted cupin superfamily sugar epimerase
MTAQEIIGKLQLEPLPGEGGFYRETYRSDHKLPVKCLPVSFDSDHHLETCIYYMITPESYSEMHKLPGSEIWHFYAGDPAEQIQISPEGKVETFVLGSDILKGQIPQLVVPPQTWQATKLIGNGKFALFGTTMAPGFEFSDYVAGNLRELMNSHPEYKNEISNFFHKPNSKS